MYIVGVFPEKCGNICQKINREEARENFCFEIIHPKFLTDPKDRNGQSLSISELSTQVMVDTLSCHAFCFSNVWLFSSELLTYVEHNDTNQIHLQEIHIGISRLF